MSIGGSPVLRMVDGKPGHLLHWCHGCERAHMVDIHAINRDGRVIGWDGTWIKPTFGEPVRHEQDGAICEYLLRGGVLSYLESCTHDMRGKSVPLPVFPEVHK